jgi:hypothetical protein
MATRRIDWNRVRQWLVALGRRVATLTMRLFHAARKEAGKDKYREYLSDAYGQMRERYPAVEDKAKEALDAIGVRPKTPAAPRPPKAKKKTTKKKKTTTKKKAASKKKTTAKKTTSKKKVVPRKKAA